MSGGGGGAWSTAFPATASGNGGVAGTSTNDPTFTNTYGGAGGGGGSANGADAGAGGGGGGGTVILHAVNDISIGTAGRIFAQGGGGGSTTGTGGAGGGGGAGGILALTGAAINILNADVVNPTGNAERGAGGEIAGTVSGGLGAAGRNWFSSTEFAYNTAGGFYSPSEQSPLQIGKVVYESTTQYVVTRSFSVHSSFPEYASVATIPVSSDFLIEVAGSNDDFMTDDTGFTTNFSLLKNKRYVKFRASITTSNVNTPAMLDMVTITYTPNQRENFEMKAAGCGRVGGSSSSGPITLLPLFAVLLSLIYLRRKSKLA
jgi:hypothetical protein